MDALIVDKSENRSSTKAIWSITQVFIGSLFLALMSQLAIYLPISTVPITIQTLAVALLTITLGKNKALYAIFLYTVEATLGLPVLKGGSVNPLWMIGPTAGYIFGFFVSSYLIGTFVSKSTHFIKNLMTVFMAELSVLLLGTLWLATFLDPLSAFTIGFLPFITGAIVKTVVATTAIAPIAWIKT